MKTFKFLGILLFLFLLSSTSVLATEPTAKSSTQKLLEDEAKIIEPGVLPNSFWYWSDKFAEQIRFVFTVGKEGKADYLVDMAKERLAEMRALSEEGITTHADELLTEHEDLVKKAQELYLQLKKEGIEKAKELQVDTERNILINEQKIKTELSRAETTYATKQDSLGAKIRAFLGRVISHLSWKKEKIQEQRSDMFDE